MVNLCLYQKSQSFNNHNYLNRNIVKALINNCQQSQHVVKKAVSDDQEKETIANSYNKPALRFIFNLFWQQSYSTKPVVIEGSLQAYLNYLLGYFLLAWGEFY